MKKVITKTEVTEISEESKQAFESAANALYPGKEIELRIESGEIIASLDCPHDDDTKANLVDLLNQYL